ncbi:hypothetical protein BD770DRAFT_377375 [Pilaira anomala]|nr:hypothetical protein BD770DRAFT_377375 [Pilaira anomala]
MSQKSLFILSAILLTFIQFVKAQLGPVISSPVQNATVDPGSKVEIIYEYQNLGPGNYSIDIQLWQDAAVTIPISDVVKDESVKEGNSTGVKVSFTLSSSYTWKVPHGLNDTFWLTVTGHAQTPAYKKGVSLRSRPLMLHTSAANLVSNKPANMILLFFGAAITFALFSL